MYNYYFRRSILLSTIFSFAVGFLLFAQTSPSYAKDLRIGFVDIQKAVSNTKEWKKEFVSFKTRFKREQESIAKK